jgi:hypothetical protein
MKHVEYDPIVIKAHALVLYRQARRLMWIEGVKGAVWGALLAFFLIASIGFVQPIRERLIDANVTSKDVSWLLFVFPLVGASRGWNKGYERGWQLRLTAQQALCQVQIEENTRRAA